MKACGTGARIFLLLAFAGWHGPADAAGALGQQSQQPKADRPSISSWCLAKCDEEEVACKAFENRYPSCSPSDICLEEKLQCETQCRPRVKLTVSACL